MIMTNPQSAATPDLPRHVFWLLCSRVARSVAQGVLAVDFALYLRSLHWSGSEIGTVLAIGLVFGIGMTIATSMASDKFGRKRFLIVYDTAYVIACLAAIVSTNNFVLAAAAVAGSFGRGANGSAGPFSALEKAWLTQGLDPVQWTRVLGLNATIGFLGMALGAALGAIPGFVHAGSPIEASSYSIIFLVALGAGGLSLLFLTLADDQHHRQVEVLPMATEAKVRTQENTNLTRLGIVNFLQGTGIGLTGPLVSYWFAIRFGVGPARIALLMSAGFVLAAVSSHLAGKVACRYGLMNVIVTFRVAALALLAFLPMAPTFPVAMIIFLLHSTLNRATNGPRSVITASLVRNQRRGFAGMISKVSRQLPRSFGPAIAGYAFDNGYLVAPFIVGALFQAGYLMLYQKHFSNQVPALNIATTGSVSG